MLTIPTASSNPKYNPATIQLPDLLTFSSDDESTTHQRNVRDQFSYLNKTFSYPPGQQGNTSFI